MANMQTMPEGSSDSGIRTLTDLYNLVGGTTVSGGGSTVTTPGRTEWGGSSTFQDAYTDTQTETSHIDQVGLDAMLKNILEGTNGLAAVSAGQRGAGGYNSSVNTLLVNDLLARAAGQVAMNNKTTTTVRNVGARSSNTVTMREIPESVTTTTKDDVKTGGNTDLAKVMAGLSLYSNVKKSKLLDGLFTDTSSKGIDSAATAGDYRNQMDIASDNYASGFADNNNFNAETVIPDQTATELYTNGNWYADGADPFLDGANFFSLGEDFPMADNIVWETGMEDIPFPDTEIIWDTGFPDIPVGDIGSDVLGLGEDFIDFGMFFADGGHVGRKYAEYTKHQGRKDIAKLADGGTINNTTRQKKQNNVLASQSNTILDPRNGAQGRDLGYNEPNMGQYNPVDRSQSVNNTPARTVIGKPDRQTHYTQEQINQIIQERYDAMVPEAAELRRSGGGVSGVDSSGNPTSPSNAEMGLNENGQNPNAASALGTFGTMAANLGVPGLGTAISLANTALGNPIGNSNQAAAISNAVNNPGEPQDDGTTQGIDATISAMNNAASMSESDGVSSDGSGGNGNSGATAGGGDAGSGESGEGGISAGSSAGAGDGGDGYADGGLIAKLMSDEPTAGKVVGKGTTVSDTVNAKLSKDEYVLPADVVDALGIDNLDALVAKYHTPAVIQRAQNRK